MGVCIRAIKPTSYLGTAERDEEGCRYIYTLDYSPLRHLTRFREGWYRFDKAGNLDQYMRSLLNEYAGGEGRNSL